jgi:hypothetical protein
MVRRRTRRNAMMRNGSKKLILHYGMKYDNGIDVDM